MTSLHHSAVILAHTSAATSDICLPIPVTVARDSQGIDTATPVITLPSGDTFKCAYEPSSGTQLVLEKGADGTAEAVALVDTLLRAVNPVPAAPTANVAPPADELLCTYLRWSTCDIALSAATATQFAPERWPMPSCKANAVLVSLVHAHHNHRCWYRKFTQLIQPPDQGRQHGVLTLSVRMQGPAQARRAKRALRSPLAALQAAAAEKAARKRALPAGLLPMPEAVFKREQLKRATPLPHLPLLRLARS